MDQRLGAGQSKASIKAYVDSITADARKRTMLKAIATHETGGGGYKQFYPSGRNAGWPLLSSDGKGAGIFQITSGVTYDDHWNWKINTKSALRLLNDGFGRARGHLGSHGANSYTADQLKMEAYAQYGPTQRGHTSNYHRWNPEAGQWEEDPNGRTRYANTVVALEE